MQMTDEKLNEIINKLPTDEELIEQFRKIKEHCKSNNCEDCKFKTSKGCQMVLLIYELSDSSPSCWNMDEIERIIKL